MRTVMTRTEIYEWGQGKKQARKRLRSHYFLFVFLCLLAAVLGTAYTSALELVDYHREQKTQLAADNGGKRLNAQVDELFEAVIRGENVNDASMVPMTQNSKEAWSKKIGGHVEIANSRGVLASIYNHIGSETFLIKAFASLCAVIGSVKYSTVIWVVAGLFFSFLAWLMISNVYKVIYCRMFLEGRVYEKVPFTRLGFLFRTGNWIKASVTMALTSLYYNLWLLTIIGGVIKFFSYFAVPYILAERPDMKSKEVIALSRKMMYGYKAECCLLHISFLGWDILNICSFGILGILFLNPYKEAVYSDYYAWIRSHALAAGLEGTEVLNDRYLYEKADAGVLKEGYAGLESLWDNEPQRREKRTFGEWLSDQFGIVWKISGMSAAEEMEGIRKSVRYQALGQEYPLRFGMLPSGKQAVKGKSLFSERKYSVCSLIMIFMTMSIIGWCWEVVMHLVSRGTFVNRGVMHGPWLPIYGAGAVLILAVLYRFRENAFYEFILTIIICGSVEYATGAILEGLYQGKRWWDYNGYFLNIDGRICAEGLLVFGAGGLVIVYLLAPILDNLFRTINRNVLIVICILLVTLFSVDQVYSLKYPNQGKGISSEQNITKTEGAADSRVKG